MTIALAYSNADQLADLVTEGTLLGTDDGLETAVFISLFTDRRAEPADVADPVLRRGWWGDTYANVPNDRIGSRLWLLARAKTSNQSLELGRIFTLEALQWLLDDGVAATVEASTEYVIHGNNKVMLFTPEITRPETPAVKWIRTWDETARRVG